MLWYYVELCKMSAAAATSSSIAYREKKKEGKIGSICSAIIYQIGTPTPSQPNPQDDFAQIDQRETVDAAADVDVDVQTKNIEGKSKKSKQQPKKDK